MSTPCQSDPELWVSDLAASRREAARLCRPCPNIADCLAGALERREKFGVWGGKDFSHATTRPKFPPKQPRPISHGTQGGYKTHLRRGEPPCEPCLEAVRLAERARVADKRRRVA